MSGIIFFKRAAVGVLLFSLVISSVVNVIAKPVPVVHDGLQQPAQNPRPFPPAQYIPDHDFDTRHIALDLRFDWDKEQILGRETLVFAPLVANLKTIKLDAANITPTAIKLGLGTELQFVTDVAKQKVNITLDRGYQPSDQLTLTIDYHTNGPQDPS